MDNEIIKEIKNHKHLGIIISSDLSWKEHIDTICNKAKKRLDVMRFFKYKLTRKTLEIFYFNFIRPILEYGNILYAGGTQRDLIKISNIEKEAKRICTGAMARCNLNLLNIECKWESIEDRRNLNVLIMLYRILHDDAPQSLIGILHNIYRENTCMNYNLRHNENIKIPYCKTNYYKGSFFPYSIKLWNNLQIEQKLKPTLSVFKSTLKTPNKTNKLFYYGDRKLSVIHAKIRMGCSPLNSHMSIIMHIKDNPSCICGANIESPAHYFLQCPLYAGPRISLLENINRLTNCNINIILFGDKNLTFKENKTIFKSVHNFIRDSRRFEA